MAATETTFEEICERLNVPLDLRKHISADAPIKGKMAVARSMLPAEPKVLLAMMYVLLGDSNPTVVEAAEKGLIDIPEQLLLGMLDQHTHPKILEFLSYRRPPEARVREKIALLAQVNDKTLFYLAETAEGRLLDIIGSNQERLLVSPKVVYFLQRNPNTPASLLDRMKSFLRMYGVNLPEIDEQEAQPQAAETASPDPAAPADGAEQAVTSAAQQVETSSPDPAAASLQADPVLPVEPDPATVAGTGEGIAAPPPPAALPIDYLPGEVYIPPIPVDAPPVVEGLENPLGALMADWGIQVHAALLAPPPRIAGTPVHAETGAPATPIPDSAKATDHLAVAANAIVLGVDEAGSTGPSVDLSGRSSMQSSDFTFDFSEDEGDFDDEFTDNEKEEMDDEKKGNLRKQLEKMTVGDKIKLCYRANKGAREVLVRDTNKIVACAVVNSGRITDAEVLTIATNRSIHEEVIRALTSNREFMRKYPVKVALAGNPKTPIPTAIGLLNSLHVKDLQKLSKNRNISSAVFSQASKLYKRRKSGQG